MIGIILMLITAICYGISATIQKYSVSSLKKFSLRKLIKDRNWVLALVIGSIGTITYLSALRIEDLSVTQVFLSLAILIPILSGVLFFKERLKVREWVFVVLILVGIFLVSMY